MSLIEVAKVTEFEEKDRKLVTVDGTQMGVLHVNDEFYALRNLCPHQYGPVAEGEVQRSVSADVPKVGERVEKHYEPDSWILRCPCHAWSFDISTGENVADPENAPGIKVYDTVVRDGVVYVDI